LRTPFAKTSIAEPSGLRRVIAAYGASGSQMLHGAPTLT
jgi:hypothetical protein